MPTPESVQDSKSTVALYKDIYKICQEIWIFSNWKNKWMKNKLNADDARAEELYLKFSQLKSVVKRESPLFQKLLSILGDFLEYSFIYKRKEFIDFCKIHDLKGHLYENQESLEEFGKLISSEEKKLSGSKIGDGSPASLTPSLSATEETRPAENRCWDQHRDGVRLKGWKDIFAAIGAENSDKGRKQIKRYMKKCGGGPITMVGRLQPIADRGALKWWWANIEDTLRLQEEASKAQSLTRKTLENEFDRRDEGFLEGPRPKPRTRIRPR